MARGNRSAPDLYVGVLNVRKERGWTSHDVVAKLRRISGQRRIGHAGTLDPLAEGVLPVLFGRATRLSDVTGEGRKRYVADVRLGVQTSTDDAEGEVIHDSAVPPISAAQIEEAFEAFRGTIQQTPPAYSAIMVNGVRAYALARRGQQVEMVPRAVTIYQLGLLEQSVDGFTFEVVCSRGTYVRSLARDLAIRLGTVGHLRSLVRTRVGPFGIEDAHTLAEIESGGLATRLLPPDRALPDAPSRVTSPEELRDLRGGRPISTDGQLSGGNVVEGDLVRVYDQSGTMRYVGVVRQAQIWPRVGLYAAEPD